jgi:hypothetical protein
MTGTDDYRIGADTEAAERLKEAIDREWHSL